MKGISAVLLPSFGADCNLIDVSSDIYFREKKRAAGFIEYFCFYEKQRAARFAF